MSGSKPKHPERNAAIVRLVGEGATYAQIARALRTSRSTVAGVAFRAAGKNGVPKYSSGHARGEAHYRCKLTEAQVSEVRTRRLAGEPLLDVAADFGISISAVSKIAKEKRRPPQHP